MLPYICLYLQVLQLLGHFASLQPEVIMQTQAIFKITKSLTLPFVALEAAKLGEVYRFPRFWLTCCVCAGGNNLSWWQTASKRCVNGPTWGFPCEKMRKAIPPSTPSSDPFSAVYLVNSGEGEKEMGSQTQPKKDPWPLQRPKRTTKNVATIKLASPNLCQRHMQSSGLQRVSPCIACEKIAQPDLGDAWDRWSTDH